MAAAALKERIVDKLRSYTPAGRGEELWTDEEDVAIARKNESSRIRCARVQCFVCCGPDTSAARARRTLTDCFPLSPSRAPPSPFPAPALFVCGLFLLPWIWVLNALHFAGASARSRPQHRLLRSTPLPRRSFALTCCSPACVRALPLFTRTEKIVFSEPSEHRNKLRVWIGLSCGGAALLAAALVVWNIIFQLNWRSMQGLTVVNPEAGGWYDTPAAIL